MFSRVVSFLRFPMAVLVVYIHTSTDVSCSLGGAIQLFFSSILGNLAVPFFFFVSGYFFFTQLHQWNVGMWKEKMIKRLHTLAIPYLLWAVIIPLATYTLKATYDTLTKELVFADAMTIIRWPLNAPTWFLLTLIILCLFSPIILYLVRKSRGLVLAIPGILYLIDFKIPIAGFEPVGWFFFMWGACHQILEKDVLTVVGKAKLPVICISMIVIAAMYSVRWTDYELYKFLDRVFCVVGLMTVFILTSSILRKYDIKIPSVLVESSFLIYVAHYLYSRAPSYILLGILIPSKSMWATTVIFLLDAWVIAGMIVIVYMVCKKLLPRLTALCVGNRVRVNTTK